LLSPLMTPFQNCVRQSRHPTNMATVAKNRKGGWNFNFFSLKLLGQLDSSFAKIILWWSPFKLLSGSPVLGPRWTLLLFINDSLHIKVGCKVLHVLSNTIKPICLGYFSEILLVEEYNICASSYIFFLKIVLVSTI
jgi:hypothetical protein